MVSEQTRVRRGFVRTSLGQLHYRTAGDGPPLVLLHNTWLSSRMFGAVLPQLAREFQVVAIDTLGQGHSDPAPPREMAIAEYAGVLHEALDGLGLEQPAIAGQATGAVIAAEATAQAPERVRRLVLTGLPLWRKTATRLAQLEMATFADWQPDEDGAGLLRAWEQHGREHLVGYESAAEVLTDYRRPGPRASLALRALFHWEPRERLPLVTTPTLVLSHAGNIFSRNAPLVAELLPNAELHIASEPVPHPHQAIFAERIAAFCRPAPA
jgi:pimeloyl-ACP methyl ester carboxylesterase